VLSDFCCGQDSQPLSSFDIGERSTSVGAAQARPKMDGLGLGPQPSVLKEEVGVEPDLALVGVPGSLANNLRRHQGFEDLNTSMSKRPDKETLINKGILKGKSCILRSIWYLAD
jgi:hypothetical protein